MSTTSKQDEEDKGASCWHFLHKKMKLHGLDKQDRDWLKNILNALLNS